MDIISRCCVANTRVLDLSTSWTYLALQRRTACKSAWTVIRSATGKSCNSHSVDCDKAWADRPVLIALASAGIPKYPNAGFTRRVASLPMLPHVQFRPTTGITSPIHQRRRHSRSRLFFAVLNVLPRMDRSTSRNLERSVH